MPTNSTRSAIDTLINEASPNTNYGSWGLITVAGQVGQRRYSFLWFSGKPPFGANISSATLRLWLQAGGGSSWSGGPHTITARRVTATWKESLLTWNRSGTGQMGSATNPGSVQVTNGVDGQMVEIDVSNMLADIGTGTPWHGIRLEVNTNDAVARRFYSSEAANTAFRPQLVVEWNRAPEAPGDVAPAGGRSVSVSHPVLTWRFKDREGDQQAEYQVQVSTTPTVNSNGFTSPEHDSGWVASSNTQHDLSATAYAGLSDGATRYWIVRARDVPGLVSPWTAPASFRRDVQGSFVINTPVDGGTVDETTPLITTTLTGRAQEAIGYRIDELEPGGNYRTVWVLDRHAAPADDGELYPFNVPAGKLTKTGRTYRLLVVSWDTVDREATPGDPGYLYDTAEFTFVRSATPSPVTALTVVQETPGVRLTWNRAAGLGHPDFWCLVVDGVRVFDRLDPLEYVIDAGDPLVYSLVYYGARPNLEHTYEIEAVVDDGGVLKHSDANETAVHTITNIEIPDAGVWLVDDFNAPHPVDALPRRVRIRGGEDPDLQIGEASATFYPIGRRDPVKLVDAVRGHEGSVSGVVDADDPAGEGFIENFEWMKSISNIGRRFRLIFGDINVPVELGQVGNTHGDTYVRRRKVSVEVYQVEEFPP